ncbi:TPD1 protein homolog 1A-like [Phragmites australis]|uniref:TPD1 protein homolog 1A-like n=1 Tax=Phragmites australis TaxID=29695 RepID=UPI002D76CBAA|nr:TPD1 protein homolog 1A-like [Phragmites australis]
MPQAKYTRTELMYMGNKAETTMRLLLLALLVLLLVQVQGARPAVDPKCAASSVEVEQTNTGEKAGYDPVFEVTVRNRCGCAVRGVSLRSEGFASSVAVDPRLFRREGRYYLVGDGRRIESAGTVRFRYAWDRAFRMAAAAVHDDCS